MAKAPSSLCDVWEGAWLSKYLLLARRLKVALQGGSITDSSNQSYLSEHISRKVQDKFLDQWNGLCISEHAFTSIIDRYLIPTDSGGHTSCIRVSWSHTNSWSSFLARLAIVFRSPVLTKALSFLLEMVASSVAQSIWESEDS